MRANPVGKDGAPPKESMGGLGEDVKKAGGDAAVGQGL